MAEAQPTLIPVYGFLEGDSLGLVVLARPEHTIAQLALELIQCASVRVWFPGRPHRLEFRGRVLDPVSTVAEAGLHPLDRIDVRWSEIDRS